MEGFGIKSGSKLRVDALTDDASYTVAGDPTEYPLSVSGDGITPINDEAALSGADHVVLYSDFMIDAASPLPDICGKAIGIGSRMAPLTSIFNSARTGEIRNPSAKAA